MPSPVSLVARAQQANRQTIELLEKSLDEAREGRLVEVVVLSVYNNKTVQTHWSDMSNQFEVAGHLMNAILGVLGTKG